MPDLDGHRPQKQRQSKLLKRRLTWRLVLDWFIYSLIFIGIGLLFSTPVVNGIAALVADNTSRWEIFEYENMPIDEILPSLGLGLLGYGISSDELDTRISSDGEPSLETNSSSLSQESFEISDNPSYTFVAVDPIEAKIQDGAVVLRYANDDNIASDGTDLSKVDLFVTSDGSHPKVTTLRALQEEAVTRLLDAKDWQIITNNDGIYVRNLTDYNTIRAFKWPVIILLYFIGCAIIIFIGYGRAMKYFESLEGAVGSLMKDKEDPVVLPPQLSITQDELNSIRLASLADERAAKAAELRKDELVAYLAHDVKTPLTSVIGYLMLLDEAPDLPDDVRRRYIHTSSEKAQRMEGLIDEFFEITRYNLQAIPIEREDANVKLFCEQVSEEFYPDATARDIRIDVKANDEDIFYVDRAKLARALGNVIRNAVAFASPDSVISVEAVQTAETPKGGEGNGDMSSIQDAISSDDVTSSNVPMTVISVKNSGREISEAHLKIIFDKFYREDPSRATNGGGSGLGLAIAKEIITAHGGTIEASSKDGETTFTISVPTSRV